MSRLTLADLRAAVLAHLDEGEWVTSTTQCSERLGFGGGVGWYKLALVLERLANDGVAALQRPGSKVRRFRRRP